MKDAVLVLGGAFNPVHTQHIAVLCLAKQELEASKQWHIIGGYLAAAPDGYVRHKLHNRTPIEHTIKIEHRLALAGEALRTVPWLAESPFQAEMLTRHDGSAIALGERVKKLLNNNSIEVLIVVGGDRMVSRRGEPIWRRPPGTASITRVCLGRQSTDDNNTKDSNHINILELWQKDLDASLIHDPKRFILLNNYVGSVSSTLVRMSLNEWYAARHNPELRAMIENDLINTKCLLHPAVMNYIRDHEHDLYLESDQASASSISSNLTFNSNVEG